MRNPFTAVATLGVCTSFLLATRLHANDGWDRAILQINEENDARLSDRHYTQGAVITFLSADAKSAPPLPSIGYKAERWKWGLEVGQMIFTPEDLEETVPIPEDRPYAGWLFGSLLLQQRGTNTHNIGVMELLRLRAGVVGPESQADETQIWWHHVFGWQRPNGWDNQLKSEVGVHVSYDRRYRFVAGNDERWSVQLLPGGGVNLGNIRVDAHVGANLRVGYNIPNEFGVGSSDDEHRFGFYVFAGAQGSAVAHDLFLEGNTFRDSQSVDAKILVGELRGGLALTWRHAEVSITHVRRSHEFETQEESNGFTSVAVTFKF